MPRLTFGEDGEPVISDGGGGESGLGFYEARPGQVPAAVVPAPPKTFTPPPPEIPRLITYIPVTAGGRPGGPVPYHAGAVVGNAPMTPAILPDSAMKGGGLIKEFGQRMTKAAETKPGEKGFLGLLDKATRMGEVPANMVTERIMERLPYRDSTLGNVPVYGAAAAGAVGEVAGNLINLPAGMLFRGAGLLARPALQFMASRAWAPAVASMVETFPSLGGTKVARGVLDEVGVAAKRVLENPGNAKAVKYLETTRRRADKLLAALPGAHDFLDKIFRSTTGSRAITSMTEKPSVIKDVGQVAAIPATPGFLRGVAAAAKPIKEMTDYMGNVDEAIYMARSKGDKSQIADLRKIAKEGRGFLEQERQRAIEQAGVTPYTVQDPEMIAQVQKAHRQEALRRSAFIRKTVEEEAARVREEARAQAERIGKELARRKEMEKAASRLNPATMPKADLIDEVYRDTARGLKAEIDDLTRTMQAHEDKVGELFGFGHGGSIVDLIDEVTGGRGIQFVKGKYYTSEIKNILDNAKGTPVWAHLIKRLRKDGMPLDEVTSHLQSLGIDPRGIWRSKGGRGTGNLAANVLEALVDELSVGVDKTGTYSAIRKTAMQDPYYAELVDKLNTARGKLAALEEASVTQRDLVELAKKVHGEGASAAERAMPIRPGRQLEIGTEPTPEDLAMATAEPPPEGYIPMEPLPEAVPPPVSPMPDIRPAPRSVLAGPQRSVAAYRRAGAGYDPAGAPILTGKPNLEWVIPQPRIKNGVAELPPELVAEAEKSIAAINSAPVAETAAGRLKDTMQKSISALGYTVMNKDRLEKVGLGFIYKAWKLAESGYARDEARSMQFLSDVMKQYGISKNSAKDRVVSRLLDWGEKEVLDENARIANSPELWGKSKVTSLGWVDDKDLADAIKAARAMRPWIEKLRNEFGIKTKKQFYLPHLIDRNISDMMKLEGFDKDALLNDVGGYIDYGDNVPSELVMQFAKKRLGAGEHIESAIEAMSAYLRSGYRKKWMTAPLNLTDQTLKSARLKDSTREYLSDFLSHNLGAPSASERVFGSGVKMAFGTMARIVNALPGIRSSKYSARIIDEALRTMNRPNFIVGRKTSGLMREWIMMNAMGFGVDSAIQNLSQGVNTSAYVGPKWALAGYKALGESMNNPKLREALRISNVLQEADWRRLLMSEGGEGLYTKASDTYMALFNLAERVNRSSAFYSGYLKAMAEGKGEKAAIEFGKEVADATQFAFTRVDTPLWFQSFPGKMVSQLGQYPFRQMQFIGPVKSAKILGRAYGAARGEGMGRLAAAGSAFVRAQAEQQFKTTERYIISVLTLMAASGVLNVDLARNFVPVMFNPDAPMGLDSGFGRLSIGPMPSTGLNVAGMVSGAKGNQYLPGKVIEGIAQIGIYPRYPAKLIKTWKTGPQPFSQFGMATRPPVLGTTRQKLMRSAGFFEPPKWLSQNSVLRGIRRNIGLD